MASKPHHDAESDAIEQKEGEFVFGPRAFNIVWGNDSRYWRMPPKRIGSNNNNNNEFAELIMIHGCAPCRIGSNNTNNNEFAELVQVSWLEVTGHSIVKASASYKITFTLSFKGDAFGWSDCPVFLMAKVGKKGKYRWKRLRELMESSNKQSPVTVPNANDDFIIDVPQTTDRTLYFGLYEVWSGKWKGGLRIHRATVKEISK